MSKCERSEYLDRQGISTEMVCHCSDDVDHVCTALNSLIAVVEHAGSCTTTPYEDNGWVEIKKEHWHGVIKIDNLLCRNYLMFGCPFDVKCQFKPITSDITTDISEEVSNEDQFLTYKEIKEIKCGLIVIKKGGV